MSFCSICGSPCISRPSLFQFNKQTGERTSIETCSKNCSHEAPHNKGFHRHEWRVVSPLQEARFGLFNYRGGVNELSECIHCGLRAVTKGYLDYSDPI